MTYLATTRVAVLRGKTTNSLGDPVDDMTDGAIVAGYESLPASLIETSKDVFDPATGTRRTVRVVTARLRPTVATVEGDRIKDLGTGIIYAIGEKVAVARSLSGMSSLTLDLEGLTGA